jgi:hypothetical protein
MHDSIEAHATVWISLIAISWHDSGRMERPAVTRESAHAVLIRAKARLDPLLLYPRPVSIDHVRVVSPRWLFRMPWFRRFDGYAAWNLILLRSPKLMVDGDLICHELCHVWQMQHRPVRMPLSYLRVGYRGNPYEQEARLAVSRSSEV